MPTLTFCLNLQVVQLQQSLQIAQLEFETRTVQLHSLKQRADEADQRAQVGGPGWGEARAAADVVWCRVYIVVVVARFV